MQHDDEIGIVRGCRRARYTKREAKEVGDPRAQKGFESVFHSKEPSNLFRCLVAHVLPLFNLLTPSQFMALYDRERNCSLAGISRSFDTVHSVCPFTLPKKRERKTIFLVSLEDCKASAKKLNNTKLLKWKN